LQVPYYPQWKLPEPSNIIQTRKSVFERALPTPNILPKTNLRANPWFKPEMIFELAPSHIWTIGLMKKVPSNMSCLKEHDMFEGT
jgi:hypothetical protein